MGYDQSFLGYCWLSSLIVLILLPIGQANYHQHALGWWFYPCMPQINDLPQAESETPLSLPFKPIAEHGHGQLSWLVPNLLLDLKPLKQRWRYWETPVLNYAMWFHPRYVPPPKTV